MNCLRFCALTDVLAVCRSLFGAAAPLFTQYMFDSLGIGGGGSLIGGVACLLAPIPFVFYKYGKPIRERSKFAPTHQPAPAQEKQEGQEESSRERSRHSSDEEELELDEEMGVPNQHELDQQIKEERSESTLGADGGDRYLDASGMEKAER